MSRNERLSKLQDLLKSQGLQAYVAPAADPHQSEYLAGRWKRRKFISGFTGSAGLFACTTEASGLWTDGRYFVQAESQLAGSPITLFRQGEEGVPDWKGWMIATLPRGSRIGLSSDLFSMRAFRELEQSFQAAGLEIVKLETDPIDTIWGQDRPQLPTHPLREHPLKFAGESAAQKLERLRAAMKAEGADHVLITALDELAWLLNLRGSDVACNPVFYGYALVTAKDCELFTDGSKMKAVESLKGLVTVRPYEDIYTALGQLKGKVWLDPGTSSAAAEHAVRSGGGTVLERPLPIATWKACKNPAEMEGMRQAHIRDGVALVKFIHWIRTRLPHESHDEITAADKLEAFRKEAPEFIGPSFDTIAGYAGHGALPHYRATPGEQSALQNHGIFLVDSGGQYTDGTTDITRNFALGEATAYQKLVYTTVLKAHLQLRHSTFPAGTNGYQLDVLARQPLWNEKLDFNHGTGHGVGAALCVHEGPFSISLRKNMIPLEPGHIVSNEPACYIKGEFGVRVENLVTVVPRGVGHEGKTYLTFEDLTLCPHERKLIDVSRLSPVEREQVDAYHAWVYEVLAPLLSPELRSFLANETRPL